MKNLIWQVAVTTLAILGVRDAGAKSREAEHKHRREYAKRPGATASICHRRRPAIR